jgi:hypothetical protein
VRHAPHADRPNALQARLIAVRRLLLLGRLANAAAELARLDARGMPPMLVAVAELAAAELALRSLRTSPARAALARASEAAERAGVAALQAEVAEARAALERPAGRRLSADGAQALRLPEIKALLGSGALVVDAWRRGLGVGDAWRPLVRRPLLFALARALAAAWPGDVDREALIAGAFRTRHPDETHRVRLRVEIGRLRAPIAPMAASRPPRVASRSCRATGSPSSCWRRPSMASRRRWRPCCRTAGRGPHLPWRSRSAPASARCSAPSPSSKPRAGCAPPGRRGRVAGCRRRWRNSRRSCYSLPRSRLSRVLSRRLTGRVRRNQAMTRNTRHGGNEAALRPAEIVREYGPFDGVERVAGVTHDGHERHPNATLIERLIEPRSTS